MKEAPAVPMTGTQQARAYWLRDKYGGPLERGDESASNQFTSADVAAEFGISRWAAQNQLRAMLAAKVISRKGYRSTYYDQPHAFNGNPFPKPK